MNLRPVSLEDRRQPLAMPSSLFRETDGRFRSAVLLAGLLLAGLVVGFALGFQFALTVIP